MPPGGLLNELVTRWRNRKTSAVCARRLESEGSIVHLKEEIDMAVRTKRIYDKAELEDGVRILVDRLWPRGITKEEAGLDEWIRDIAPSTDLRVWFAHKPDRWQEFRRRYTRELSTPDKKLILNKLRKIASLSTVTLLYAAKDSERNNAVVLSERLSVKKRSYG